MLETKRAAQVFTYESPLSSLVLCLSAWLRGWIPSLGLEDLRASLQRPHQAKQHVAKFRHLLSTVCSHGAVVGQ